MPFWTKGKGVKGLGFQREGGDLQVAGGKKKWPTNSCWATQKQGTQKHRCFSLPLPFPPSKISKNIFLKKKTKKENRGKANKQALLDFS